MIAKRLRFAAFATSLVSIVSAQTFQRLGTCPTLGCILPPDAQDFLAGQYFDIRLEIHAPVNGSEATDGNPDETFSLSIAEIGEEACPAARYFDVEEPELEKWNFTWYEDLFAQDANRPSLVNVVSKVYRHVALNKAGEYEAILSYNGTNTTAHWTVRDLSEVRKAENVLLFVGDGMTTNMVTAARLIAHRSNNGRYLSKMAMDKFPVIGHQMTHSIDSFITDSANSATALYSGHKSSVNALGVYADSSADPFDDPKVESIMEMFYRIHGGKLGIVSTAIIADATPGAFTGHTRDRGEYGAVVDSYLNGIVNYTWTDWPGYDVVLGAEYNRTSGAEQFCAPEDGGETYQNQNYYSLFSEAGYSLVTNNTELLETSSSERTLGIFSTGNMDTWLDKNVYTDNLIGKGNSPDCLGFDTLDQPGLKQMTVKAIDILDSRARANGDNGWFLMSEAALIDKQMHALDYDRALGELLEFDDTVQASIAHLEAIGQLEDTLVIVTADHGHGFDVFGSYDTQYGNAQSDDRSKRSAIGTYEQSGLSQYVNTGSLHYSDSFFPSNWDPRYTLAQGLVAHTDMRENYQVHRDGVRSVVSNITGFDDDDYFVDETDNKDGFVVNGTLPSDSPSGVHSLTDVPVYAQGPCQSIFGGTYDNTDVFYKMAECLGLSRSIAKPTRN